MLNNNQIESIKYLSVSCLCFLYSTQVMADVSHINMGNYSFVGNVVITPCQIAPESEKVSVDFKQISVKDLYSANKSKPIPFSIHLINCSTSVFKAVTVTFNGIENQNLPEHLAINEKSVASGIGIGLLNQDDTPIKLNSPSSVQNLTDDNTEIKFKAYVEAEPDALRDQTITYGTFYSTAYYTLNYQ